jgi:hypothetical protein
MATQQLKTVVKIGADVDKGSFNKIGSAFNKAMGKSVKAVKKLEREQKDLLKQIKKTEKAGGDIRELSREYDRLGREISQASRKAKAFQTVQGTIGGAYNKITKTAKVAGVAAAAAGTAVVGSVVASTNETAKMAAEASSFGVSGKRFSVWGDMADDMKMTATDIGKITVDMRKKIGRFLATGQGKEVGNTLEKLGITPDQLKGKEVAEQLDLVLGRLENISDATDQATYADILLGGKSIRLLTALKKLGTTWNEFYLIKEMTNLFTDKNIEGAKEFSFAIGTAMNAIKTGIGDISGFIGGEFYKSINAATIEFSKWYKIVGREKIKKQIVSIIDSVNKFRISIGETVKEFGGWNAVLGKVGTGLKWIVGIWAVSKIIGMSIAVGKLAVAFGVLFKAVLVGVTAISLPVAAIVAGVGLLAAGAVLVWKNWDWLMKKLTPYFDKIGQWFEKLPDKVKDSLSLVKGYFSKAFGYVMGKWNKLTQSIGSGFRKFKEWFGIGNGGGLMETAKPPPAEIPRDIPIAGHTNTTNNISNVGTINVATQPGQNPRDFASELEKLLIKKRCGTNFDSASPV